MTVPRGVAAQRIAPSRRCLRCSVDPCRCPTPVLASPIDTRPLHDVTRSWANRQHPVAEGCACGVDIRSASGSDEDILYAVQRHQVEPVHIAYDEGLGIPLASWQRQAQAVDAIPAPMVPLVGPYTGSR